MFGNTNNTLIISFTNDLDILKTYIVTVEFSKTIRTDYDLCQAIKTALNAVSYDNYNISFDVSESSITNIVTNFKIELVSVRIRKRIKTDFIVENTNYYYQDSGFIKVEDNHFIKKSNTNVVYHYYGSNNRTKLNGHNKHKQSFKSRFYKKQLEYKGWFYDLPDNFDIRKDWETVYNAYLTYLQNEIQS